MSWVGGFLDGAGTFAQNIGEGLFGAVQQTDPRRRNPSELTPQQFAQLQQGQPVTPPQRPGLGETLLGMTPIGALRDAWTASNDADQGGYAGGRATGTALATLAMAGIPGARRQGTSSWLRGSLVRDEQGLPLVVYRGEHGLPEKGAARTDPSVPTTGSPSREEIGYGDYHSRLPSLSFGSRNAANTYAMSPNVYTETAEAPRVTPAFLKIKKPIINAPDDPFVDFSDLAPKLGDEFMAKMAHKHAAHIENTNNWREEINPHGEYLGVADFLKRNPGRLRELYMDSYPLLDDPEFVKAAKAKGYDGAIHMGNGETALDREYRVFDHNQARPAIGTRIKHGLLKGEDPR